MKKAVDPIIYAVDNERIEWLPTNSLTAHAKPYVRVTRINIFNICKYHFHTETPKHSEQILGTPYKYVKMW